MSAHASTSSFARALDSSLQQRGARPTAGLGSGSTMAPAAAAAYVAAGQAFEARVAPGWQWSQTVVGGICARLWTRLLARRAVVDRSKRLRLVETVNLGEKRFAAILEVQGQQFLVGGGTAGVSLLARLDEAPQPVALPKRERTRSAKSGVATGEVSGAAILEAQAQQLLVGGGTAGVSLLARVDEAAQPVALPKRKRARSAKSGAATGEVSVEDPGLDRVAQSREQW